MKKNKIIPFSLLFITLTFLELFCIVKYSDVFYFPLAVGITMLGSAYLLLTEIKVSVTSFIKEREEKVNEMKTDNTASVEKEEAAKLAKATYVLEKRILNLLEERMLMPEENIENLSSLQSEIVRAIKASIKYERENANHIADIISNNQVVPDNSISPADLNQILAKFDALALELKSSELTISAVKEQLQTITDITRQISDNRVQYVSQPVTGNIGPDYTEPVIDTTSITNEEIVNEPATNDIPAPEGIVAETDTSEEENIPEFVDTLTMANNDEAEPEPVPVSDDPGKKMSPEDIAALFAASEPEPAAEPAPAADPVPAADPDKKMSPEDIAALFASANLDLEPEPSAPEPKTAIETLSKSVPEVTPVSDDPNKKMSPEDIAALFASAGQ